MATPKVLILRAPGTNCDRETEYAFQTAGAHTELVHINRILENARLADKFQILCLPGGFSYGDDIAAGRILANQIRHHLTDTLDRFKSSDKLILGICNGFQVLVKAGILWSDPDGHESATLTWNDSGKFEDRWVQLAVEGSHCVFFEGIDSLYLPIAHAEGKFVVRDADRLETLRAAGQLALRYTHLHALPGMNGSVPYPDNPNGSIANVAGVCDETGRVLGLMPHPERHVDRTHHPRWTRGEGREVGEGLAVFHNAVKYFQ